MLCSGVNKVDLVDEVRACDPTNHNTIRRSQLNFMLGLWKAWQSCQEAAGYVTGVYFQSVCSL